MSSTKTHGWSTPMPTNGRLGVATIWLMWLAGPVTIFAVYVPPATWLGFTYMATLLVGSVWIVQFTNKVINEKAHPRPVAILVTVAPLIIFGLITLGWGLAVAFAIPLLTVVATGLALVLTIAITPVVASTANRQS